MIKGKIIAGVIALLILSMALGSVMASTGTIWYQAATEEHDYNINKVVSDSDTTFSEDNYLSLSAEVDDVDGPTTSYGDSTDETTIEIIVGATGHSEWYEDSYGNMLHQKPRKLKIEATLSNHETPGHINWQESYNTGVNVGGSEDPSGWKYDGPMSNTIKESAKTIATSTPEGAIAMTAASFAQAIDQDTDNTKYIEEVDGDSGTEAHIVQKYDINKNDDGFIHSKNVALGVWEGTMNFTVSSKILWTIPADLPKNSYTISLSASLLMRKNDGSQTTDKWGAETDSVDFTIKNGEIKSIYSANSGTGGTSDLTETTTTGNGQYSTTTGNGLYTYTDTIAVNTNQPFSELPKVDVKVDWGDGNQEMVRNDWEPYYWEFNWDDLYYPVTKYIDISHTYGIVPGQQKDFTIEITAESSDGYGGWKKSISYDLTINYLHSMESLSSKYKGTSSMSVETTTGDYTLSEEISVIMNHPDIVVDSTQDIPKVDVTVDWGDGTVQTVESNWEPYTRQWVDGLYKNVDRTTFPYHTYTLSSVGDTKTYNIEITAEASGSFGGVSQRTVQYDLTVEYIDDGGGGGGGGGCPYVSPWNGTEYNRENNILPQSEYDSGEVTDNYKLDSDLQEKNGSYSMKIEEFENSEDFIDQMDLYTLDHKEGYNVGVTPEGEYTTYKGSEPPESAHNSTGADITDLVEAKDDGNAFQMNRDSEIVLDYGDISKSRWVHKKLVLRSSGFSSYTDENASGEAIGGTGPIKTSLNVSIKAGNSNWHDVAIIHPRNHPHDHVIPLEDPIGDLLKKNPNLKDFKVKIESTKQHNLDYVGIDDSVPQPVDIQKANLTEAIKTDINGYSFERSGQLRKDDSRAVHLIPGEQCTVRFDVPDQIPGNAFKERDFVLVTNGFYKKYQ